VTKSSSERQKRFQEALNDPESVYGSPERVLADPRLDREGKRAILKAWERDARALARAADEAMSGGEENMLDRVLDTLRAVSPGEQTDEKPMTRLGKPPRSKA
jgi:hypothetical protein